MKSFFVKNSCDGAFNSFDVHFTSACDNKCAHCIDLKYTGIGVKTPNPEAIADTIIKNSNGYDDVLFLGGEPCLYLNELIQCIKKIQTHTSLKVFVTTSVPKTCYTNFSLFKELIELIDGLNISTQHYDENISDEIRKVHRAYDRQEFYKLIPHKEKVRVNLNIVKPFLYTKEDIINCLNHYDAMGFNEIKLSEIQHGDEYFVSFEKTFGINLGSPYFGGCQKYIDMKSIIPNFKTPLILKRSCFMCEETLTVSPIDTLKVLYKAFNKPRNKYGIVYEDGTLTKGWV